MVTSSIKFSFFGFIVLFLFTSFSEGYSYQFGVLKYNGGGDWYSNPTSVPNLVEYCNTNLNTSIDPEVPYVEIGSPDLFNYPYMHMTGHGNVVFSAQEAENLRLYLEAGGFLHIDDNFGMDPFVRLQMKKVFPEYEFIELPFKHGIYHQSHDFPNGLPKIHEHEGKAPQGFGIIHKGRLVCFYTFECDLGDGWEDFEVHKDSEETRTKAFRMGANIVEYVLMGEKD